MDPVDYQVIVDQLGSVAADMQEMLFRSGYSTIIRESQDASCAVLTADGRVIGQHVVLPLHMGAFPACAAAVLDRYPAAGMRPEDVFVLNDPYAGGSPHPSDVAVLKPVLAGGEVVAFTATMAHKPDMGGMVPGTVSGNAIEVFQEGLQVPPVRFTPEVADLIARNSRVPDLVLGDLRGQAGSCALGAERVAALYERWGRAAMEEVREELFRRTELRVRQAVAAWPDGVREAEIRIDGDGIGPEPVLLRVRAEKRGTELTLDFAGSSPQSRGPLNIRPPLVEAACAYVLVALIDVRLPVNDGLRRTFTCRIPPRTALNPERPAPVNSYIIAAHAVVEIVLRALSGLGGRVAMAESGGGGGLAVGWEGGQRYIQYEVFGSSLGARWDRDGVTAVDVHIANCRCTPIEILESEFPVRLEAFEPVTDSGGAGTHRGGLACRRVYRALAPGRLTVRTDRFRFAPRGVEGGGDGGRGGLALRRADGEVRDLPSMTGDLRIASGDEIILQRPGGGGYGDPRRRPRSLVRSDVLDGYVSPEAAVRVYGWAPEAAGDRARDAERDRAGDGAGQGPARG